jgi:hypothetical protein
MSTIKETIKAISRTFPNYTARAGGIQMRPYQTEPANAIIESITKKQGLTIVLIISRQAGKDELLANLLAYLMTLYSHREVGIVVANPTYKPQTINAIMRLENRLKANLLTKSQWKKRSDYMRMMGSATTSFLSGDKAANVVGAVASLLLVINEAQDISPAKYDKDFAPMVASTNATRLIVGTVWTSRTLLAREEDAAREAEKADGIHRVFLYTSEDVRKIVPAYGQFVDSEIKKLGREHPLVKTQYFCERIDAQSGMFGPARRALMRGDQPAQEEPNPSELYAFTLDVAGQDEASMSLDDGEVGKTNPGRDQLTLDIISVDLSALDTLQAPIYRVVKRFEWTGENHIKVFGQIDALWSSWNVQYMVMDATGVGEGLWAMFDKRHPTRVIPIKYTAGTKSDIGYGYLAVINTGRFRDCCPTPTTDKQYENVKAEILTGPAKTMRWSVPDGTRDENGELIHDDHVMTDSQVAILDKIEWSVSFETVIIENADPISEMDRNY